MVVKRQHRGTGTTPGGAEAHFPGYDVLGERHTWDDETTGVVLARLGPPAGIQFFTEDEQPCARALVDRLLAQDDDPKVPVLEMVDQRLLEHDGDGYRYEDMPEDWDAWRRSIAGLDDDSRARFGCRFHELTQEQQMAMIEAVRTADGDRWGMPAKQLFSLWLRYTCTAFYAHPWAWNEIGYGGPAYPRGYVNLGLDRREWWEQPERDWHDPIPWVRRAESERKKHLDRLANGGGDRTSAGTGAQPGGGQPGGGGQPDEGGHTGWGGAQGTGAGGQPSGRHPNGGSTEGRGGSDREGRG
jgi:hypothetical protein